MRVLADVWEPGLDLVLCGTAVGPCAAERGHHYAQRGDAAWRLLHDSGLTTALLRPDDEALLTRHGVGLVDLVKRLPPPDPFDVAGLLRVLEQVGPGWVAFNGRVGADAVARALGEPRPSLGRQRWTLAGAHAFVLPSSSGANQRRDHGGRPDRLSWWAELASLVTESRPRLARPVRPPAPPAGTSPRSGRSAPP
ncbi:mismatch-specific DNA-glycosylase [Aeromicrobium endophyticum]|uniref:Mismatch-specific DNA-glycosylase n=1 Tax=Aeromicrobium endophyticum TaxID=2292704 RepID=A0A371P9M0_9ACTN|nr:mismatch-specific DNA-glycosylase [Aeromicrobium endophyticum]REK72619.1 mismatch-specific DNA-glycosylase [Aeromicrobium endophyticum]